MSGTTGSRHLMCDRAIFTAGVFPVVISRDFALALTIYTVATHLLLYYVRKLR